MRFEDQPPRPEPLPFIVRMIIALIGAGMVAQVAVLVWVIWW